MMKSIFLFQAIQKFQKIIPLFSLSFFLITLPISAQPSGGPYGPVQQKYDLPKVGGKIYYVAPGGNNMILLQLLFGKLRAGWGVFSPLPPNIIPLCDWRCRKIGASTYSNMGRNLVDSPECSYYYQI